MGGANALSLGAVITAMSFQRTIGSRPSVETLCKAINDTITANPEFGDTKDYECRGVRLPVEMVPSDIGVLPKCMFGFFIIRFS